MTPPKAENTDFNYATHSRTSWFRSTFPRYHEFYSKMAFGWMKRIYFKIHVCIVTGKRNSSGVILKYLRNHLYCDDRHGHSTMRWKISRETRFPGLLTLATNDNFRDERVYRMQIANTWRKRVSTIRLGVFFLASHRRTRESGIIYRLRDSSSAARKI